MASFGASGMVALPWLIQAKAEFTREYMLTMKFATLSEFIK